MIKAKKFFSSKQFSSRTYHRFFSEKVLPSPKQPIYVHNGVVSGRMPYVRGWAFQQILLDRRLEFLRSQSSSSVPTNPMNTSDGRDTILMFEHDHVYTLGRGADEENLTFLDEVDEGLEPEYTCRWRLNRKNRGRSSCRLDAKQVNSSPKFTLHQAADSVDPPLPVYAPNGVPIYRIERGGEVTYHGPGQLVVYPMLDLRNDPYKQDLHWYLRCIEEVIIRVLKDYSITGVRDDINTGVWVNKKKIAAVGLSSARWITTHGFALNVDPDLDMFDTSIIIPCGIQGRGVTSIAEEIQSDAPSLTEVSSVVLDKVNDVFGVPLQEGEDLH